MGLRTVGPSTDVSTSAHNASRSLRSNAGDIMAHVDGHMMQCLRYRSCRLNLSEVRCFWQLVGIHEGMLALFTMVDPVYSAGHLDVNPEMEQLEDIRHAIAVSAALSF